MAKRSPRTGPGAAASRSAHAATAPQGAADAAPLDPAIRPGQSVALLQALHILTRDARLNQDSRRKLKQVYHLYQFIEPLLQTLVPRAACGLTLADHGAGKSYLGFILYDLYFKQRDSGRIFGIETRPELVQRAQELAANLGFARMEFLNLTVAESVRCEQLPAQIDVVTALHACDTATDDAIAFGLHKQAQAMVLVPCCQAEAARLLNQHKALNLARTPLAELWRHPLHARELGSQVTNVLRCLYLQASGYQVTVTELVGWEHSLKNELILARRTGQRQRAARERLLALLQELGLQTMLDTRFAQLRENSDSMEPEGL